MLGIGVPGELDSPMVFLCVPRWGILFHEIPQFGKRLNESFVLRCNLVTVWRGKD